MEIWERPKRNIMAAERMVARGLALSSPAMSGAEPWQGSKTPGPEGSPTDAEGSIPSEPTSIDACTSMGAHSIQLVP